MLRTVYLVISVCLAPVYFSACSNDTRQDIKYLPFYNSADFTPLLLNSKEEVAAQVEHTIAPFEFTDQEGKTITDKAIDGKIHVADFIFTSCGNICPALTAQMSRIGEAFRNDSSVVILSYTVTPWIDTPEVLKKYKEKNGIKKRDWYFLTGNKSEIYNLARTSYFAEESMGFTKDSTQFLHTEHFVLVDGSKRIRGIYNGTLQLDAEQLIKDIERLKKEDLPASL